MRFMTIFLADATDAEVLAIYELAVKQLRLRAERREVAKAKRPTAKRRRKNA
jgi:hypothetical protein